MANIREAIKEISNKVLKDVTENFDEIMTDQGLHNEKEMELNKIFMDFGTRIARYTTSCKANNVRPREILKSDSLSKAIDDIIVQVNEYINTEFNDEIKEKFFKFTESIIEAYKDNEDKGMQGGAMFNTCMLHCYEKPMKILDNLQKRIHEISQGDIA